VFLLEDELEQKDYITPRLSEGSRNGYMRDGAFVEKFLRFRWDGRTPTSRLACAGLRLAHRRNSG
jgi:hypothetical protein